MTRKFLICPGYMRSSTDGDEHFITSSQLMRLYEVNPADCDILSYNHDVKINPHRYPNFFDKYEDILQPRYDGRYYNAYTKEIKICINTKH